MTPSQHSEMRLRTYPEIHGYPTMKSSPAKPWTSPPNTCAGGEHHACDDFLCTRCDDPGHMVCLSCGRWLALAIHYELHPEQCTPVLVKADGNGQLNALGQFVSRKMFRQLGEQYEPFGHRGKPISGCVPGQGLTYYISARNMESEACKFGQHWWYFRLQLDVLIDKRCRVRTAAVNYYWDMSERGDASTYLLTKRVPKALRTASSATT